MPSITPEPLGFTPIPLSFLEFASHPPFDTYIESQGKYVKFAGTGLKLTHQQINELKNRLHHTLYIQSDDQGLYYEHMRNHVGELVNNPFIPTEEKSKMIYDTATEIVNSLFQNPESQEAVHETKQIAQNILSTISLDHSAYISLIKVSSYDYYTYTHCINVSVYSLGIGQMLGLPPEELRQLGEAAILHDLGKAHIDSSIINKQGPLTDDEFEIIKQHPVLGDEILRNSGETESKILEAIRHHHEKQNGSGYPDGLLAEDLSFYGQIITIADVFDALTTRRSYKPALKSFQALKMMKHQMPGSFNDQILDSFIQTFH